MDSSLGPARNNNIYLHLWWLSFVFQFRFNYTCECPNGIAGFNCHQPGCGGTYLTETFPQEISVGDQTDLDTGCTWTFESPPDTRGALRIKSISYGSCYDFRVTIWKGNFTGSLQSTCLNDLRKKLFMDLC